MSCLSFTVVISPLSTRLIKPNFCFIFCVLINTLLLTSPTGTSKRLVHADIALTLVAFLGFVT